jgi:hypothetical protein
MVPGPMSGLGPRGYVRSEDSIREEVCERLSHHGQLDASDIEVGVDQGVVILRGTVDSRWDKRAAEDTAETVPGVFDVQNMLRVRRAGRRRGMYGTSIRGGRVRQGMEVVGSDGGLIGEVKEVRDEDVQVDRHQARDLYIPLRACQVRDGKLWLNIPARSVDEQKWDQSEAIQTPDLRETE